MFLDTIHGIIDRRVLLNYRIDPAALKRVLPSPLRPKLYGSHGVGGVGMIRFKQLRPRFVPAWLGLGSENAAHRIAVEWEQDGELRQGVLFPVATPIHGSTRHSVGGSFQGYSTQPFRVAPATNFFKNP